jgi:hypothetical protein
VRRETAFAVEVGADIAACAGALPWAWASCPFETASTASALKRATSAVRESGSGREALLVFTSAFLSLA